jgi:hypothetical protein
VRNISTEMMKEVPKLMKNSLHFIVGEEGRLGGGWSG